MLDIIKTVSGPFDLLAPAPRLTDLGADDHFADHLNRSDDDIGVRDADTARGSDRRDRAGDDDHRRDAAERAERAERTSEKAESSRAAEEPADEKPSIEADKQSVEPASESHASSSADTGAESQPDSAGAAENQAAADDKSTEAGPVTGHDAAKTNSVNTPAADAAKELPVANGIKVKDEANNNAAAIAVQNRAGQNGQAISDTKSQSDAKAKTSAKAETAQPTEAVESGTEELAAPTANEDSLAGDFPFLRGIGLLQADALAQADQLPELIVLPEEFGEGTELSDVLARLLSQQTGKPFIQSINITTPSNGKSADQGLSIGLKVEAPKAVLPELPPLTAGDGDGSADADNAALPQMRMAPTANPAPAAPATPAAPLQPASFDGMLQGQSGTGQAGAINTVQQASGTGAAMAASQMARPAPVETAAGIQIAIHISRAVQDGIDRFSVRLNPPELGRVDIKLEVAHDGRAIAVVSADRQETLDLLQRDARGLERALQEAGLKADSGSLNFSLRQDGREGEQAAANNRSGSHGGQAADEEDDIEQALPKVASDRLLDISV
jgi:flagellar hook-length control protein FliK